MTDRDLPAFVCGVVGVRERDSEWIQEHRGSLSERETVFLQVGPGFSGVPFVDHAAPSLTRARRSRAASINELAHGLGPGVLERGAEHHFAQRLNKATRGNFPTAGPIG